MFRTRFLHTCIVIFCLLNSSFGQIQISEFQVSNITTGLDPYGNYLSWVEIYNAGSSAVNLNGYYLTDDFEDPEKARIGSFYIGAKNRKIIWLDPKGENNYLQLKLSMDGEELGLFSPSGAIVDTVRFGPQLVDMSYGRDPAVPDQWVYFSDPSPGLSNSSGGIPDLNVAEKVQFSLQGGFYNGSQVLELSSLSGEGTIWFTSNGSWPGSSSTPYSSPILINETTVIRARIIAPGKLPGPVQTHSFILDDSTTVPVISITVEPDDFFSNTKGIYVRGTRGITGYCSDIPANWYREWERPMNVEYFTAEGDQKISQLTGTKIFGVCSRERPFKSLSIMARKKYGDNSLSYPFFRSKEIDEYKSIVIRNAGNDSWRSMIRDGFMQNLLVGKMDIDYQAFEPAIIYINGEYWGVQNIREKINEHYGASNFNMDSDEIDMLERNTRNVVSGSAAHYEHLIDYASDHNLAIQEHFDYVSSLMDMNEFMNYWLVQLYFRNYDWPESNAKFWRPNFEGGKWRWILFDTDTGWGAYTGTGNIIDFAVFKDVPWTVLIRELLDNPGFKDEFVQRMASMINTIFKPENVTPIFDSIFSLEDPEMERHIARWGIPAKKDYDRHITEVIPQFTIDRPDWMRENMRSRFNKTGLYTLGTNVNDPSRGYISAAGMKLPADFSGKFYNNTPLRIQAISRSGFKFSHWEGASASTEETIFLNASSASSLRAVFEPAATIDRVYINEVNAINETGLMDDYAQYGDWVELYNDNEFDVNLAGWFISDNPADPKKFRIPDGFADQTTIKANDYLILWCDGDTIQGPLHTNFRLNRNGEPLSLTHMVGNEVDYMDTLTYHELIEGLTYGPIEGTGKMEYMEPTPYAENALVQERELIVNEFMSKNCGEISDEHGGADDWIEVFNPTADTVDLAGLFLTDSLGDPIKHMIPKGSDSTKIPPDGFLTLWADGQTEQGVLHLGFKLSGRSEQIGLYQAGSGYLDSLTYSLHASGFAVGRIPDGTGEMRSVEASPEASNYFTSIENLYVNEFMSGNRSSVTDEWGEFNDWIEIYNNNDHPVDIGGLLLTDSLGSPFKHSIPLCNSDSTTIPPKGFIVLWADNQVNQGVLHLGFKLDADGEQIGLFNADGETLIDTLSYFDGFADLAEGRLEDGGELIQFLHASPGAPNGTRTISGIHINEFMAVNGSTINDPFGENDDWIELFNSNDFTVDVGGMFITDSLGEPAGYRIPSSEPDSTTIDPKGYLVLWADNQVEQGVLHLDFKLSGSGEQIGIVQPDGLSYIDSLTFDKVVIDQAMGLIADGSGLPGPVTASPGASNHIRFVEGIHISEFVASGNELHADDSGEFDDWIELYNSNSVSVDLGGMYITDSLEHRIRCRIPSNLPDSTTIAAGGYLILWADGQPDQGVLHLDLKLGGGGESLGLVQPDGTTFVDSVSFPNQYRNFSYSRTANIGSWKYLRPTYGSFNRNDPITGIQINEFSASNNYFADNLGEFDDWIEIYNGNDFPVDLGGLYLTDTIGELTKFRIPSHTPSLTTIEPGGFILLFADDQEEQGINHLDFKLSRDGEHLVLTHYDEESILDSIQYPEQYRNTSYSRLQDSEEWFNLPPTPGHANVVPDMSDLVINEVMGDNKTSYSDDFNEYDDWIEIYNSGEKPLNIGGLYLADSLKDPVMYRISSEYPDSTTIQPKDYLVLWADKNEEQGVLHLEFKISKTGEGIGLFDYTGNLIDSTSYPLISPDHSWGRSADGIEPWMIFSMPTPMKPNLVTTFRQEWLSDGNVSLYPNPVSDHAIIHIGASEYSEARFEVLNTLGSVISLREFQLEKATENRIEWDLRDGSGSKLIEGLYIYRITMGNRSYTGKFLVDYRK